MRLPNRAGVCLLLLALTLVTASAAPASDTLYGVFYDQATASEILGVIDPVTGSFTPPGGSITDCCWISSGVSTLDPDGQIFYFVGRRDADASDTSRIFALDLADGSVISDPILPADTNYNFLEFDPSTSTLYSVVRPHPGGVNGPETLVIIDPTSGGTTTPGGSIAACCFIPSGVSALDPTGQVFYFIGRTDDPSDTDHIFALDLADGSLLSSPLLPTGYNYNFLGFDWTPSPQGLVAVVYEHSTTTEKLVAVNPATGALTAIGAGIPGCCLLSSGVSAVDPNGDIFYFVGHYQAETEYRIFGLDLDTGNISTGPLLATGYNYNFIQFDPAPPTPAADLQITKDDGLALVQAGASTTYTIEVTNVGPSAVTGATVSDSFPAGLTCSWTCSGDAGTLCTTGPVSGDLADSVDLPAGAAVTYTASCAIAVDASGTLLNTAAVAVPAGVDDPQPANDEATDSTDVNRAPVAQCRDLNLDAGPTCTANGSVDDGSFDPDGDPITVTETPAGPFTAGATIVTLLVEDDRGGSDTCEGTVTVVDDEPPVVSCNSPSTIIPPDAPISFVASATDGCGAATTAISAYDCFTFTRQGRRVDKTSSCVVLLDGATVTVADSGGVGDTITWTVEAADASGNTASATCSVEVVNPGKGKGAP